MKELPITPGNRSRTHWLVLAVMISVVGGMRLEKAWHTGAPFDWISSGTAMALGLGSFLCWLRFRSGWYVMDYTPDRFRILEKRRVLLDSAFDDLRVLDEDGRGYTLEAMDGSQWRLLRGDVDDDLARILDAATPRRSWIDD